ncbi:hypothetical protein MASR1M60_27180 [Rhodocyclaceae bacterium]
MNRKLLIITLLGGTLLAGCASTAREEGFAYAEGWRRGTVVSIGQGEEYRERLASQCADQSGVERYAMVRYTGAAHLRWRAFPLTADASLAEGNRVFVSINSCRVSPAGNHG